MNVGKLLTKAAQSFPENVGIVYGTDTWTYAEFNARANRFCNRLSELGVGPGDHVALLMYNCPAMLEAMFACFKMGCGAVPINFRLHPNEFAFIIDHSQATAVVTSPEFNAALGTMRDRIPQVRHFISTSDAQGEFLSYEALLAGVDDDFDDADVEPDDVA